MRSLLISGWSSTWEFKIPGLCHFFVSTIISVDSNSVMFGTEGRRVLRLSFLEVKQAVSWQTHRLELCHKNAINKLL